MEREWLELGERVDKHRRRRGGEQPEPDPDSHKFCHTTLYRKRTLKVVKEAPFIGLFKDLRNISRFEGSALTAAKGAYWAVFDSLRTIARIDEHFQFRGDGNALVPEDVGESESQFEGLQYMAATDSFVAVRESVDHATHGIVPLLEEIKVAKDGKSWKLGEVCPAHFFGLEDANKGWEAIYYYEAGGERYLLGQCESNYCKTIVGDDPPGLDRGHGRLILTRYAKGKPGDVDACAWEVIKEIKLPREAAFLDYSGLSFPAPFSRRAAITSQEDAAVWVGEFDWDAMEFVPGGRVYHFPRDEDCDKVYCNIEGVTWLDNTRLMFASDRSKAIQDHKCMANDQSVHIFALP